MILAAPPVAYQIFEATADVELIKASVFYLISIGFLSRGYVFRLDNFFTIHFKGNLTSSDELDT